MRRFRTLTALAIGASLIATAACTTNPETGNQRVSRTAVGAIGGTLAGYLLGDVVGGRHDRAERIIGAGIGAIDGGAVGNYRTAGAELRPPDPGTGGRIREGDV